MVGGDRYYEIKEMKGQGYDLKTVEDRVSGIFEIGTEDLYAKSREK